MMMIDWARFALACGFYVFPVEPGEKTPIRLYQDRPKETHPWTIKWGEVATDSPDKVNTWWTYAPNANIGIACKPSRLLVIDIDNGDGKNGEENFERLVNDMDLCSLDVWGTYTVRTGSGGYHLYYRWPDGVTASQTSICKDVDVRTTAGERGGYVLGAGSVTGKGTYRLEYDTDVAPAPPQFVELVRAKPRPPRMEDTGPFRRARHATYDGIADRLRLEGKGNRNALLYWSAFAMADDGADIETAYRILVPAAVECGLEGGERQARQTIESGYRAQGRK